MIVDTCRHGLRPEHCSDCRALAAMSASSPYAGAEMFQQEMKDRAKAHSASEQKLAAENERLRTALKAIVGHWDEFGPEYGFAETIDRVARPALQPTT